MSGKDEKLKSILDSTEKDGQMGNLGLLLAILVGLITLGNFTLVFLFFLICFARYDAVFLF